MCIREYLHSLVILYNCMTAINVHILIVLTKVKGHACFDCCYVSLARHSACHMINISLNMISYLNKWGERKEEIEESRRLRLLQANAHLLPWAVQSQSCPQSSKVQVNLTECKLWQMKIDEDCLKYVNLQKESSETPPAY